VKRTAEADPDVELSAVRFTDYIFIFFSNPTDESVGYYHSSAWADWKKAPEESVPRGFSRFRSKQQQANYP
jgi:hypothetical protein